MLYSRTLLAVHFKHGSVYMPVLNLPISSPILPPGNRNFSHKPSWITWDPQQSMWYFIRLGPPCCSQFLESPSLRSSLAIPDPFALWWLISRDTSSRTPSRISADNCGRRASPRAGFANMRQPWKPGPRPGLWLPCVSENHLRSLISSLRGYILRQLPCPCDRHT